jgi:hypothetical protein
MEISETPTFGMNTLANIAAVAKREQLKPSWNPIATASAVTVAECDDGIPPEPISCLGSHLFSLYLCSKQGQIKLTAAWETV